MKIGISMGDPAGIGPEVTLKALTKIKNPDNYLIIGSKEIIEFTKKKLQIKWNGKIENCTRVKPEQIKYGKISRLAGRAAYQSVIKGCELIRDEKIDALVTAPICKASLKLAGFDYPGHTELLAEFSKTRRFAMMLAGIGSKGHSPLRVTLVTTHIPLSKVPSSLSTDKIVEKIELTYEFLKKYIDIKKPRIAVCSLNPHSSEFGNEENKIIIPAVKKVSSPGIDVKGPYPADTLFTKTGFDAIIAMYHDQGLIPLKLKEFGCAVNITLGLPFVRTSPDHGTGFDIAGKGIANHGSMLSAIIMAEKITSKRRG